VIFGSFAFCRDSVFVKTGDHELARMAVPMIMTAKQNHISDCSFLSWYLHSMKVVYHGHGWDMRKSVAARSLT
jgi:hypothetical protein